ncbi:MAG TPA: hypothetical protein ENK88_03505 [Campylobacterales bacterium]|nr:hypothetical protein [Arcobacter sp.]HHB94190.1 hypothetical protein [Campylobacterales bacterium]HHD80994.1 hypothetical protein [Campylobacterales bacterium]
MSLQCHKCGKRNTEIVSAEELSNKTGATILLSNSVNGFIAPEVLVGVLGNIAKLAEKILEIIIERKKNKRKVIICKDCGFWERV